METTNMKNMVVLKNLPSNLVDEAIVILKPNKKVRKREAVENNKRVVKEERGTNLKKYIVKEAEMVISDYIKTVEEKNENKIGEIRIKTKYKNLKKYSFIVTILLVISIFLNLI
jgi:hypothetical protein